MRFAMLIESILGPEFDDDDDDNDGRDNRTPVHGIDDGFFPDLAYVPKSHSGDDFPESERPSTNGFVPKRRNSSPMPPFPYTPPDYGGPNIVSLLLPS